MKAYRIAYKKRKQEENEKLWLAGAYVYQAICKVTPLLNPFSKNPKADPYLDKPFPFYEDGDDKPAESNAVDNKGMAYMLAQMTKINSKFGH